MLARRSNSVSRAVALRHALARRTTLFPISIVGELARHRPAAINPSISRPFADIKIKELAACASGSILACAGWPPDSSAQCTTSKIEGPACRYRDWKFQASGCGSEHMCKQSLRLRTVMSLMFHRLQEFPQSSSGAASLSRYCRLAKTRLSTL